ncbi:PTS sugar transporter subunit IIA [Vibrio lentus]|nr:PTS sugar transporter subunit IIA [Vibrio lentus]
MKAREEQGNTGFEEGIALPRCTSRDQTRGCYRCPSTGHRNCGAIDGQPSKLFFMIASPDGVDNHHIENFGRAFFKTD